MRRFPASFRRFTLWLACCAILLNALVPTVSHAMAASRADAQTAQICTAAGLAHPALPDRAGMLEDCGYCLVHAASFALAPPDAPVLAAPAGHALRLFLFYHAPQPLLALRAAAPRGPPASN